MDESVMRETGRAIERMTLLLALMFGCSALASAAPVTFNTALPVAHGEFVFREILLIANADDAGPANRNLDVRGGISVLGYGVSSALTLFGMLPYLDKDLELAAGSGPRISRGSRGIGDLQFFGRYTVWRRDGPGRTFRIAPFVGVELPTGEDDEEDAFGRLPQPLQRGAGSWNPFAGIVATYQTLDYQVDAQASYEIHTKANDFEVGEVARLDGSLQYRFWPRELASGIPAFFYGVLEANLIHRQKNQMSGMADANSGGSTLSLTPGLQYVTKRWVLEGVVQVPVLQDLHGTALEDDYIVHAGFRVNW
jgi:hypothetical protein